MTGVLRDATVLYWVVSVAALVLVVWKAKFWWGKAIGFVLVLSIFGYFPVKHWFEQRARDSYAREAWAHFNKLCAEKSGQKIDKTVTGVKGVLIVKPLPPATEKDLYDQYWYGDPYSDATPLYERRGISAAIRLVGSLESRGFTPRTPAEATGFDFVEIRETKGPGYIKVTQEDTKDWAKSTVLDRPASRFGVIWEDISTPEDRKYWVAGSRLRVVDLATNSAIAERTGYFIEAGFGSRDGGRRPWLAGRGPKTTCPALESQDFDDRLFIHKVLVPVAR